MNTEVAQTKICNKCGGLLSIEKFSLMKGKSYNPYYLNECKECEYKRHRSYLEKKNWIEFSDDLEILIERQYKNIKPERILDISKLKFIPLGTDEIFVELMDYKNTWLSNYGRVIRFSDCKYNLLQESYDNYGVLGYSLRKNIFCGGHWIYKSVRLHAAKAIVEEFIVNPDKAQIMFIYGMVDLTNRIVITETFIH